METETSTLPQKNKRVRATKEQMELRKRNAMKLLLHNPVTIQQLAEETGLEYQQAQALIQKLLDENVVQLVGRDTGHRNVYQLGKLPGGKSTRTPRAPAGERSTSRDGAKPSGKYGSVLSLRLGQELEVIGLRLTPDGPAVEVKADQDILLMTLAS